jgi:hypothetical protein
MVAVFLNFSTPPPAPESGLPAYSAARIPVRKAGRQSLTARAVCKKFLRVLIVCIACARIKLL